MNYKVIIMLILGLALLFWIASLGVNSSYSTLLTQGRVARDPHTFKGKDFVDCEDYLVIISASKLAKRLKRSKDWVLMNYQINLYADTLNTSPRVIGHAPPGSHCFIVQQSDTWFFVQSPVNHELGWVHQKHVVGFVKKDPITLLPCPG